VSILQLSTFTFLLFSLFINLVNTSLVSATFELSGKPCVNHDDCFLFGHLALANGDHVTITVLFGEACSLFIPNHGTPNPAWSFAMAMFVIISYTEQVIITDN
jgi:hypothetical protein